MQLPVRTCYAGEKLARAHPWQGERLGRARRMAEHRADPEDIRRETGWFVGRYDGRWRTELPPSLLDLDALPFTRYYDRGRREWNTLWEGTLGELVREPVFFEAYPELRGVPVELYLGDTLECTGIYHYDAKGLVAQGRTPALLTRTALHELQHAIQGVEGFALGGCPHDFRRGSSGRYQPYAARLVVYARLAGEIEAYDVEARVGMDEETRRLTPPFSANAIDPAEAIVNYE